MAEFPEEVAKVFSSIREDDCYYTSHFCEENIYKLGETFRNNYLPNDSHCGYVVFISSTEKAVPIFMQKLAKNKQAMVVWDYHVVFVVQQTSRSLEGESITDVAPSIDTIDNRTARAFILDFDSVLPFGCSAETYMANCFPPLFCSRLQSGHQPVSLNTF